MKNRKLVHLWPYIALAVLAVFMATPVLAQSPTADEINEVAKKLSCPTCTGINVADCPTETCAQWRAKIGEMLAGGNSEQEILDYFSARYGDHVLQVPPKRGFFVLVWVLPVIAIIVGLVWLVYLMRGWSQQRVAVSNEYPPGMEMAAVSDATQDEYLQRVQQDLEKLA